MPLFVLLACFAPDLPDGWEDAEPIADFEQAACDGDPYETEGEGTVTAAPDGSATAFEWEAAHFRCAQAVEGYARDAGGLLQVLVQPVDMHPTEVAGCDCLYDIRFTVPEASSTWELWRRWDALNDPNEPVLVGASE